MERASAALKASPKVPEKMLEISIWGNSPETIWEYASKRFAAVVQTHPMAMWEATRDVEAIGHSKGFIMEFMTPGWSRELWEEDEGGKTLHVIPPRQLGPQDSAPPPDLPPRFPLPRSCPTMNFVVVHFATYSEKEEHFGMNGTSYMLKELCELKEIPDPEDEELLAVDNENCGVHGPPGTAGGPEEEVAMEKEVEPATGIQESGNQELAQAMDQDKEGEFDASSLSSVSSSSSSSSRSSSSSEPVGGESGEGEETTEEMTEKVQEVGAPRRRLRKKQKCAWRLDSMPLECAWTRKKQKCALGAAAATPAKKKRPDIRNRRNGGEGRDSKHLLSTKISMVGARSSLKKALGRLTKKETRKVKKYKDEKTKVSGKGKPGATGKKK
jgi:hypothetical protein